MGERDFAGARDYASADQAGIGDGVMRGAIGALADEAAAGVEDSGDAVDFGGLERFFESERRQDGGHALGQHGFAGAGRADHQDVVASGAGDFDGALGGLLAADVFEIDQEFLGFVQQGVAIGFQRDDAVARVYEVDYIEQGADGVDVDSADHGGFAGVGFGDDQLGDLAGAGFEGDGERAANAAHAAVERQLADEQAIFDVLLREAAVGAYDAERHGQVESRAFFLYIGGSEVDGDVRGRNVVAAVFQGGADAVAAFADGGVGQADGVKVVLVGLDAGAVDFYLDDVGVDAVDRGAEGLVEHGCSGQDSLRAAVGTPRPDSGM